MDWIVFIVTIFVIAISVVYLCLKRTDKSEKKNICDLEENQKRWLFVGIYLHTIISPILRKYVEPKLGQLWQTLKTSNSIDTQQYPNQLMSYPPTTRLNYEPINNNKDRHGNQYNNRTKQNNPNYDYRVLRPVDLSKLFLQTHMAHYTAFDDSCDSSALLGMIVNINFFQQKVRDTAKKIKDELRNPWAHCNFKDWDDKKYQHVISLIQDLVKSLKLPKDDENDLILLLNKWTDHGEKIINGSSPEQELVKEVRDQISFLMQNVRMIAGNQQQKIKMLQKELTNIDTVLADHSIRIQTLEQTLNLHSEEINKHSKEIKSTKLRQDQVDSLLNDPVPVNVREQIKKALERWLENDQKYVPTRATKHVLKIVQDKNCVTITGPSGCGKTFTARHTAMVLMKEGYDIIPIYTPSKLEDYYKPGRKMCFIVDDICGNFTANQQQVDTWRQVLPVIENIVKDKSCKIIVSCRLQVFYDDVFKLLVPFTSCVCSLVSTEHCLTLSEKSDLIKQYTNVTINERKIKQILGCVGPFLPLLCSLYRVDSGVNIIQFIQNPFNIINKELDALFCQQGDEGKYKICALALIVLFNNKFEDKWFQGKTTRKQKGLLNDLCNACGLPSGLSKNKIQTALKTLLESFIQEDNKLYKAVHDKIFDFLAWYFGKRIIECLIGYGDGELLHERMRYNLVSNETSEDMKFIIDIPEEYLTNYIERLLREWSSGKIVKVFDNCNMKNQLFRKKFLTYLKQLSIKKQNYLVIHEDEEIQSKWFSDRKGSTPLIESCCHGYKDLTEWVLCFKVDINQSDETKRTALHYACKSDNLDMVRILLEKNANVKQIDKKGKSPLILACQHNNLELVSLLLERNPDVNRTDEDGQFPLYLACKNNNLDMVKMLLERNPDINKTDRYGVSPLYRACFNNNVNMVKLLLKENPDVNLTNSCGQTPLYLASMYDNLVMVRLLLTNNPDVQQSDTSGRSPLYWPCQRNNLDMVLMLLEKNPNINQTVEDGKRPLHWACRKNKLELIRMLIERNCGVNLIDTNGEIDWYPLYWADKECHYDILELLVKKNPKVQRRDINKNFKLFWACAENNLSMVRKLLKANSDINQPDNDGKSSLLLACEKNNLDMVSLLLKKNPDVNKTDKYGRSPLHWACQNNNLDMVRMLLAKNPNVNQNDTDGRSPLYLACQNNNLDVASLLVERNPDINQTDKYGRFPLYWACKNNNLCMVSILIKNNPIFNRKNKNDWYPLYWACREEHSEILELLLERDSTVAVDDIYKNSLLHWACEDNNSSMVSKLLEKNVDVNKSDEDRRSPLYWACQNNNEDIVKMLLDNNPDVNQRDGNSELGEYGKYPLHLACENDNLYITRMLLENNADVNTSYGDEFFGITPLHIACKKNNLNIVQMLLEKNPIVDYYDNHGQYPLLWACQNNNLDIVTLLLEKDPCVNTIDIYGRSPLYWACVNDNLDMVKMLLERNPDINKTDRCGVSPLYTACSNNNIDMVKLLLEENPDVNLTDSNGKSPLYLASRHDNLVMVRLLLMKNPDVQQSDTSGRSSLYWACQNNNLDMILMLLEKNPNINQTVEDGKRPLHWACRKNKLELVRMLLERNCSVNLFDTNGQIDWYPLYWACKECHGDILELLLKKNSKVPRRDLYNNSNLFWACEENNLSMVRKF